MEEITHVTSIGSAKRLWLIFIICFVVFVVLMILWIIALIKQKDKLITAGVSARFGGAGMGIGFIAFAFLSAMATMT